ncbi:Hypothetical predicted protein [Pelobates cultripes]|uniref:Uncharacterized protein n=1 Tax=Pelobates cultripes TaxID=61616 RepID=A0AAD1T5Z4_PELCU|nr:Hypothetical predicted protein [Pelobates cultripes]
MRLLLWVRNILTSMGIESNSDSPLISLVFRVRKSAAAPSGVPRDVIAVTRDVSARSEIMQRSREMGAVPCEGHRVAICAEIPFSVSTERKRLAPVARRRRDSSIRPVKTHQLHKEKTSPEPSPSATLEAYHETPPRNCQLEYRPSATQILDGSEAPEVGKCSSTHTYADT